MNPYVTTFQANTERLSEGEKRVVETLEKAAKLIAPLYEAQKNSKYPGAALYPPDATREEIEEAAKKNSAILSPYTFVERNGAGKLVAVPYSKKFKKELTEIAKLLKEAALASEDKALKAYLLARAKDLLQDNFDTSNILWLKTEQSKIGFVIGPFDRFLDNLFFAKRAYKAYIGVLDEEQTKEMEKFRAALLAARRKYLPGAKKAEISNMKLRVENTTMVAGLGADTFFVADNLPASADIALIKKYGTISTVFKPVLAWRFDRWIFPTFQSLFTQEIKNNYTREELWKAFVRITAFCEICHSLMRYDDAASRLQETFPKFDNIHADVLTIKSSSLLFLKGLLSQRELEAILLAEICQGLYYMGSLQERPHLETFAAGYTMFLDVLLEGRALQRTDKKFLLDFQRALIAIDELSFVLEYCLSLASRSDAQALLKKVSIDDTRQVFKPQLQKILQSV